MGDARRGLGRCNGNKPERLTPFGASLYDQNKWGRIITVLLQLLGRTHSMQLTPPMPGGGSLRQYPELYQFGITCNAYVLWFTRATVLS
jgi:hypothetical protein